MDIIFKPYAICKDFNWIEIHLWAALRAPAIEKMSVSSIDSMADDWREGWVDNFPVPDGTVKVAPVQKAIEYDGYPPERTFMPEYIGTPFFNDRFYGAFVPKYKKSTRQPTAHFLSLDELSKLSENDANSIEVSRYPKKDRDRLKVYNRYQYIHDQHFDECLQFSGEDICSLLKDGAMLADAEFYEDVDGLSFYDEVMKKNPVFYCTDFVGIPDLAKRVHIKPSEWSDGVIDFGAGTLRTTRGTYCKICVSKDNLFRNFPPPKGVKFEGTIRGGIFYDTKNFVKSFPEKAVMLMREKTRGRRRKTNFENIKKIFESEYDTTKKHSNEFYIQTVKARYEREYDQTVSYSTIRREVILILKDLKKSINS